MTCLSYLSEAIGTGSLTSLSEYVALCVYLIVAFTHPHTRDIAAFRDMLKKKLSDKAFHLNNVVSTFSC